MSTKAPSVRVLDLQPVKQGCLLAFLSVQVGQIKLHRVRLVQQPGQPARVLPPQEVWKDESGQRRYVSLVQLPRDWQPVLRAAALQAWQAAQGQEGDSKQ